MSSYQAAHAPPDRPTGGIALPRRDKQLMSIVDHCTVAKTLADQIGDKFLSYLLAMSIQEASGRLGLESGDNGPKT